MKTLLAAAALAATLLTLPAAAPAQEARPLPNKAVPEVEAQPLPTGQLVYMGQYRKSAAFFAPGGTKKTGSVIELTELLVFEPPLDTSVGAVVYQITRTRLDCAKRTNHNLGGKAFDGAGKFLTYTPAFDEGPNKPETLALNIAAIVCDGAKPGESVIGYAKARELARARIVPGQ